MILFEKIHKREALYVKSLNKKEFGDMFPCEEGEARFLFNEQHRKADYHSQVVDYIDEHIKTNFQGIPITYGHGAGKTCGRLYAKNPMAIQRLNRKLRGFLTKGLYRDYDMKSAHPTFTRQKAIEAGLETTYQDLYLNDRTKYLKEANVDKHHMLAKLNTDNARFPSNKSKVLHYLVKEWNAVKKHYNGLLRDDYPPNSSAKNKVSSTFNQKLCDMENTLLMGAIQGNEASVLMFDGFMSEKEVDVSTLPSGVVSWDEKENDSDLVVPDNFDETDISMDETKTEKDKAMLPHDAAEFAYEQYPHFVKDKDQFLMFNDADGMYTTDKHIMTEKLHTILRAKGIQSAKQFTDVLYFMKGLQQVQQAGFIQQHQHSSLRMLLFKNGIYRCDGFHEGFDTGTMFTTGLRFEYSKAERAALKAQQQTLLDRFFIQPLGEEVGMYFAECNALALMGEYMKKIFYIVGPKDAGKSTISMALKHSCDKYCGTINAGCLSQRNTMADEGQVMRPFFIQRDKRFIVCNEMNASDKPDENIVKKITGGDVLSGRTHGGEETEFIPHFKAFCYMNDPPDFSQVVDEAFLNRVVVINYTKPYTADGANGTLKAISNKTLMEEFSTMNFQKAFIYMLLDVYDSYKKRGRPLETPEAVKQAKKDNVNYFNFDAEFNDQYIITHDPKDYVSVDEITNYFKSKMPAQLVGKRVKKAIGCESTRKYVDDGCGNSRRMRVYIGVRERMESDT